MWRPRTDGHEVDVPDAGGVGKPEQAPRQLEDVALIAKGVEVSPRDPSGNGARPLLVQPETYWYSTRPMKEQARRIVDTLHKPRAPIAFSADLAPDLIVPWRHPTLTAIYSAEPLQLDAAGLVPAEGRTDASIVVRWTSDRTLLTPAGGWPSAVDDMPLTDPVQQWWDLLDLGGDDRRKAADPLRRAIIDRTIPAMA